LALFTVRSLAMAEEKKEILEASSPVDGNHGAEAMLEMILNKEDEISRRMKEAEAEAEHVVEEAKLDAAAMKREATVR